MSMPKRQSDYELRTQSEAKPEPEKLDRLGATQVYHEHDVVVEREKRQPKQTAAKQTAGARQGRVERRVEEFESERV
jgi:hypothetical protein